MSTVALKPGAVFVKRKHELSDTLKVVEGISTDALALFAKVVGDTDEPMGNRLKYAEKIINLHIQLADIISKDELTRQIAEVKLTGPKPSLEDDEGVRKPSAPRLDMQTVQKV